MNESTLPAEKHRTELRNPAEGWNVGKYLQINSQDLDEFGTEIPEEYSSTFAVNKINVPYISMNKNFFKPLEELSTQKANPL